MATAVKSPLDELRSQNGKRGVCFKCGDPSEATVEVRVRAGREHVSQESASACGTHAVELFKAITELMRP